MESPSQDKLLLIRQCFARLNCSMHFDFRHTLSQDFRENTPPQTLAISRGAHERKGPWCLALAKPHFWKLGCCIWNLFLETQHAMVRRTSGRCKDVLQDHGIWLTFGSLAATYGAVPFSCWTPGRQEVVALNKL